MEVVVAKHAERGGNVRGAVSACADRGVCVMVTVCGGAQDATLAET
eukprot:COSAG01_NODE_62565_length_284_cov_0.464865_1_plen_45_part_10